VCQTVVGALIAGRLIMQCSEVSFLLLCTERVLCVLAAPYGVLHVRRMAGMNPL
jgi:hypothetical protein